MKIVGCLVGATLVTLVAGCGTPADSPLRAPVDDGARQVPSAAAPTSAVRAFGDSVAIFGVTVTVRQPSSTPYPYTDAEHLHANDAWVTVPVTARVDGNTPWKGCGYLYTDVVTPTGLSVTATGSSSGRMPSHDGVVEPGQTADCTVNTSVPSAWVGQQVTVHVHTFAGEPGDARQPAAEDWHGTIN